LGLANFYRRFVLGFSHITWPLSQFTKGGAKEKLFWSESQQKVFTELKHCLCSAPVLPTEAHGTSLADILNDFVDHETDNDNVVEKYIVTISLGSNNDQLTLRSQVTPPSWLVEAI